MWVLNTKFELLAFFNYNNNSLTFTQIYRQKPTVENWILDSGDLKKCNFNKISISFQHRDGGDSDAQNDKAGYRNDTMLSFQTSPGSVYSIMIIVCVSGGSEEIVRRILAFDIGIKAVHIM